VVSESVAQGASLPRGVGACIHTLPESVVSLIPWRPRCSEEAAVPLSGQTAVKEALFQRGEVCCSRQQTGDLCADPFLRFRQCGSCRQARALDAANLRLARQGGEESEELRQQRLRVRSARGGQEKALHRRLCGAAHWGGDLRAGEKVRERAGVAGEARARRISRPGDRTGEHTGTRRRRFGRAGVHTENAWKQTRRQRFGVAGRCDVHRGGDVRAGQRAGSGSVQSARLVWRRR
jgi:hypothetical protein